MKSESPALSHRVLLVLSLCLCALSAGATSIELVTIRPIDSEPPAAAGGDSGNSILSPDGRFVLFSSTANNLVATSSNTPFVSPVPARMNVFLRDRSGGTNALVSVNTNGISGNGDSLSGALSTNGQFALFESSASDLVNGDTNNATDIFVRDLVNGQMLLVSVGANATCANGGSRDAVMTPDGRFVAFVSSASNLVSDDTNGIADIFVHDLVNGTTMLASPGAMNVAVNPTQVPYGRASSCEAPQITPDGRYLAFLSTATNLVPGVTNAGEVYLRDLQIGTTIAVSAGAHDLIPGALVAYNLALSDDGQFVAFEAAAQTRPDPRAPVGTIFRYKVQTSSLDTVSDNALATTRRQDIAQSLDMTPDGRFITYIGYSNATPGITNTCVFVWDAQSLTTTLVSGGLNGTVPADSDCQSPSINESGRFISFLSMAANLTTNVVSAGDLHLYVRDLQTAAIELVDVGTNGVGSSKGILNAPRLTPVGRFITFDCADTDVVAGDGNGSSDVFLRDLVLDATERISERATVFPSETLRGGCSVSGIALSADGRCIAFASNAALTSNDTNRFADVYVRDLLTGAYTLVSVGTNGYSPASSYSISPLMSADGRYVAFVSNARLVTGASYGLPNVFVRDLVLGTTVLATTGAGGTIQPYLLAFSADGRYLLFLAYLAEHTLYVRDLQQGSTFALTTSSYGIGADMSRDGKRVAFTRYLGGGVSIWDPPSTVPTNVISNAFLSALSPDGRRLAYVTLPGPQSWRIFDLNTKIDVLVSPISGASFSSRAPRRNVDFSSDGRYLVYVTGTSNSVSDVNRWYDDVYVYDFETGTNELISQTFTNDFLLQGTSDAPTISPDGRFVTYRSYSKCIVPGVTNVPQILLYDRQTHTTTVVGASVFTGGLGNSRSQNPVFSGDSQSLVFRSWSSDLLLLDFNQNPDLFSWKLATGDLTSALVGQIIYAPTSGKSPTLTWLAVPGKSYQVQYKNDLNDPSWLPLSGDLTVIGGRGYATDLAPHPDHRFYRIKAY